MKKILCFVLCIILFVFTGCGNEEVYKQGYTFTDDLGREVTVSSAERVATLLGSFSEVWHLAGGTICAAADDTWDDYDNLPIPEDAINLGNTENLNFEKLIEANPDLIIASTKRKQHLSWEEPLNKMGISIAYFDVSDFDEYLDMLKICTDITKREDLYVKNGLEVKASIDKTIEKSKKRGDSPKILFLRASSSYIRAKNSKNTVLGEMLHALGCINIADYNNSLLENISVEKIIEENPKYIFVVQAGDNAGGTKKAVENMFGENPLWKDIDAYRNNRVHFLDKKLYSFKPNSRWGEAYEKLEQILEEK